ncbi:MAG: glycosyltransferase family 2 protein, partial [Anaerolineales bacterium]
MLVSIITPSYNQAEYLEQTIRSVLCQDYPNIEYVIVDGGSTDGSVEIIQKYAGRLAWWVSEPDGGQAEAINKGFARARGEIVAWLNSDDLYAPGAVAQAVAELGKRPGAGMVYGNAVSINRKGRPLNDMVFANWGLEGLAAFEIICQPAVFMRRDALEQAGYLDTSYHLLLDHHLWLRIAGNAGVWHMPKVWAFSRHHPEAKNVALAEKFGEEAYRILSWLSAQPFDERPAGAAAQGKPCLGAVFSRNRRRVWAAAHRFNARYLLDGGLAWPAFKAYLRSFFTHPPTALREWHRFLFLAHKFRDRTWSLSAKLPFPVKEDILCPPWTECALFPPYA